MAPILSSVGLTLDIVGAVVIFLFGLPAAINREGHSCLILEETDETMKQRARRYEWLGRAGLGLPIVGFVGQLLGTLFQACSN